MLYISRKSSPTVLVFTSYIYVPYRREFNFKLDACKQETLYFFIQTFLCQNKLNSTNVIELQRKIELELQSFRFFFHFYWIKDDCVCTRNSPVIGYNLSVTIRICKLIGYFMVTFDKTGFLHHGKR